MNADGLAALMSAWVASVQRLPEAQCLGRTDLADLEIKSPRAAIDEAIEDVCLNCRELLRCAEWLGAC
ncbi:hypothetical protein BST14_26170 [Mycobacterium arosiense ATCC BAA-1401 = DSM 45069]|uniref:4Fe-4S Wbl-type domain-containing protein n=1 Tax=Mycobacterium arosiense ATCC BAA-1401 = DSM 45069 TaxID=1265311 RepID=A0A1W9Z6I8_MYCAI|nr:hypothetical protein BST14_26170 [Mycobacterium arosiense ATCC BAA-1401 = DSM 45069]